MTESEQNLLQALRELEGAVQSMSGANPKPNFLAHFTRLDALARQLPSTSDPTLLHYLHKKSYEKARLFLQGLDRQNQIGHCRHD